MQDSKEQGGNNYTLDRMLNDNWNFLLISMVLLYIWFIRQLVCLGINRLEWGSYYASHEYGNLTTEFRIMWSELICKSRLLHLIRRLYSFAKGDERISGNISSGLLVLISIILLYQYELIVKFFYYFWENM